VPRIIPSDLRIRYCASGKTNQYPLNAFCGILCGITLF
jgi:hypothetical protein